MENSQNTSESLITPQMARVMKACAVIASCVVIIGALIMNVQAREKKDSDVIPFGDLQINSTQPNSQQQPQVQGVESGPIGPSKSLSYTPPPTETPSVTLTSTPSPSPTSTPTPVPTSTPTVTPTSTPIPTTTPTTSETSTPSVTSVL
jgi:hypothetical protein